MKNPPRAAMHASLDDSAGVGLNDANLHMELNGDGAGTIEDKPKRKGRGKKADTANVKGRKDSSGQENAIELDELRLAIDELEQLQIKAIAAKEAFSDCVKAVAERAGLMSAVVRKFIDARVKDKGPDRSRAAQQLSLCFSEIGTD